MRNSAGKRLQPADSAELWEVLEVVPPYGLESVADLIYVLPSQSKSRLCYVSLLFFLMVTGSRLSLHHYHEIPAQLELLKKTKERATCSC